MSLGFVARGLVMVLAAHAIISTLVALALVNVERRVLARGPSLPEGPARRLWRLRLAPTVAALAVAWIGVPLSYLRWEPGVDAEPAGPVALAAAGLGALLIASGGWRAATALWQTRRAHAALRRATRASLPSLPVPAFVVETPFPIVALVGLVRSRLFVAEAVRKACTADEFSAVIGHELAHARSRDNLRRIALIAAPDILGWMPAGARIQQAWAREAELAADETAARCPADRLHLASALVRVARLAGQPARRLPASALDGGEPIAERVRRLVDPPAPAGHPRVSPTARCVTIVALAGGAILLAPAAYAALEALMRIGLR
ncbi:MAG: M56 family metallopeptidase [Acidobacteria bacterium]|nr:M56 family metallopeptidase [Acidobacteriota bacterium]